MKSFVHVYNDVVCMLFRDEGDSAVRTDHLGSSARNWKVWGESGEQR